MKKIISIVICIMCIVSMCSVGVSAINVISNDEDITTIVHCASNCVLRGDVDRDGEVTAEDARLVMRAAVGLEEWDEATMEIADVKHNGGVVDGPSLTVIDARLVLRMAVGLAKKMFLNHKTETVIENNIASTCTEAGSFDIVSYCVYCNQEINRDTISLMANSHTPTEAVIENYVEATCTDAGSFDVVVYCADCGEEISRETATIPAVCKNLELVTENYNESTCKEEGSYDAVVYCKDCGKEISRNTIVIPVKEHTASEAVKENINEATCEEDGSYDTVVYCSVCGDELFR